MLIFEKMRKSLKMPRNQREPDRRHNQCFPTLRNRPDTRQITQISIIMLSNP